MEADSGILSTPAPRPIATLAIRDDVPVYPSPPHPIHLLLRSPSALFGLAILTVLVICALFAEQIAPYPIDHSDLMAAKLPPVWHEGGSWAHVLGTDQLGQDILSRIIYGARVSMFVGFFGVLLASTIGVSLGLLAGYLGGWVDTVVTSFVNVLLSVPYLVLVIVIAAVFGRNLLNVILIFGVTSSPIFVRLTRGEVLRLSRAEYVLAAQSQGATTIRVLSRHILPNLIGPLITLATLEMSAMIFYESGLSFLGLSVPPEIPSWGNMLTLGRRFFMIFPWIAIFPGLAIAITALGVNLLGDWLRDVMDPRLRRSR